MLSNEQLKSETEKRYNHIVGYAYQLNDGIKLVFSKEIKPNDTIFLCSNRLKTKDNHPDYLLVK